MPKSLGGRPVLSRPLRKDAAGIMSSLRMDDLGLDLATVILIQGIWGTFMFLRYDPFVRGLCYDPEIRNNATDDPSVNL